MNPLDNVERRDSDPHAHARLVAPDHDTQELYERHLNAVCHAIRITHPTLVDAKFVAQVMTTLSCRAAMPGCEVRSSVVQALDILADQIEDL